MFGASSPRELLQAEQIDAACDAFEQAWIAGQAPRIEDILTELSASASSELFRGLMAVELELRLKREDRLTSKEYERRFPEQKEVIRQLFLELKEAGPKRIQGDRGQSTISLAGPAADTSIPSMKGRGEEQSRSRLMKSLGRFEILDVLGTGAFGTVYRARDPKLDRLVAIKVPNEGVLKTADDRERFLREARAAANLAHPHICPVHEVGEHEGHDFIVMGFVDGKPLSEFIPAGKITPRQAGMCVRKLALAFQEAHERGIVHRDIKPSNVMVSRKGEPIVMDFGLARLHRPGDAQITQSGQIMGSPAYMSPEQARGASENIGPPSDIYSLGVVLYELLCGRRPFSGTVTEVLGKILHVAPPPPSTVKPGIDPALEAICRKAMAKSPAERYVSMREFAEALGRHLKDQSPLATSPGTASATVQDQEPEPDPGDMFAAVAQHPRSITRKAVKQAVRPRARSAKPPWLVICLVAAVAAMITFSGIWFFVRKDTVTVVVQIPIDTRDPSLSFLLDEQPIEAELLAAPIELQPGEHQLLVNKDNKLFRRFLFNVGKADNQPVVVQDVTPHDDWTPLFNGRDLTGWRQVGAPGGWSVENGELVVDGGPLPESKDRGGWLLTERSFSDFVLELEFNMGDQGNSGVGVRCQGDGFSQAEISITNANEPHYANESMERKTGALHGIHIDKSAGPIEPDVWHRLQVEMRGRKVTVRVNDVTTVDTDLDGLKTRAQFAARPGFSAVSGPIGLQKWTGTVRFRDIRMRDLSRPKTVTRGATTTNSIGMKFVTIPAGEFLMGTPDSEPGRWDNEGPPRTVSIPKPFSLGMYEVTQEQYERIVGINPSPHVGPNLPVGHVRWDEAKEFCRLLSELPAERAANRAYRLPSEEEWEYACRAGTSTAYHFGDSITLERANFNGYDGWGAEAVKLEGNAPGQPVAVGSYPPNAWGLYDMHGNVPEACEELWENQTNRVIRGGGWNKDASRCRAGYRAGDFRIAYTPRLDLVGFRVVMVSHTGALPDVDRMVAEWATLEGVQGTVTLIMAGGGTQQVVPAGEPLPSRAFSILVLDLSRGDRAGDTVLGRLSRLPEIRTLNLSTQPITDAGLRNLYPLKSLRKLSLQGTQVTAAGVEALRRELPLCEIGF